MSPLGLHKSYIQLAFRLTAENRLPAPAQPVRVPVNFVRDFPIKQDGHGSANRVWHGGGLLNDGDAAEIHLRTLEGSNLGAGDGRDIIGQPWDVASIVALAITNDNTVGSPGSLEIVPGLHKGDEDQEDDPANWVGNHTAENGGALAAGGVLLKVQPAVGGFGVAAFGETVTLKAVGGPVKYTLFLMGRTDDITGDVAPESSNAGGTDQ